MNTYIKRLQSRLSKDGYKVSLQQLREVYPGMVIDVNNPTDEELETIKQHFMNEQHLTDAPTTESSEIELSNTANTPVTAEPETLADMLTNYEEVKEETSALTPPSPEMKSMVSYKASEMGIQLAASEIEVIAAQVETDGLSFTETLKQIEEALTAFIGYQESSEASQVTEMYQRVTERIVEKNQATASVFATETNKFKAALEVAKEQQKSQLSTILNRLRVAS